MKKHLKWLFLLVFLLIPTEMVFAADSDWTYTLVAGEATNVRPATDAVQAGDVVIPSTLDGYPVTSLDKYAFWSEVGITSITIPEGVTVIGESTFNGCASLERIILPDSLQQIGLNAFRDCWVLPSISIPFAVTRIESGAFLGGNILTSVVIMNGSCSIAADSFDSTVTITAEENSLVHAVAVANGNPFVALVNSVSSDVSLSMTIEATLINITITPSCAIIIDPNTKTASSSEILIVNNTNAPVIVSSTPTITKAVDSYFTAVSDDTYTDWDVLNRTESKDIAFNLNLTSGWKSVVAGSKPASSDTANLVGTIAPKGQATLGIENIRHGNSFGAVQTGSFTVAWIIELE